MTRTLEDTTKKYGREFLRVRYNDLNNEFLRQLNRDGTVATNPGSKEFIENYGDWVVVTEDNSLKSVFWDENLPGLPSRYKNAVRALRLNVEGQRVVDSVYPTSNILGKPTDEDGNLNLHATIPDDWVLSEDEAQEQRVRTREMYRNLHSLTYNIAQENFSLARNVLSNPHLPNGERNRGMLTTLSAICTRARGIARVDRANNHLWNAARSVQELRSDDNDSVLMSMLIPEDSKPTELAMESMYLERLGAQVAQSSPDEVGDTPQHLEQIILRNGLESAFKRRYAKLSEIPVLWSPRSETRNEAAKELTGVKDISWTEFRNTVLADAKRIGVYIPEGWSDKFVAVTQAEDPAARPILKWDSMRLRNSFSWYRLDRSQPQHWNLQGNNFYTVSSISLTPNMFMSGNEGVDMSGVIFYLRQARPLHKTDIGLHANILTNLFDEVPLSLREFTKLKTVTGHKEGSGCGVMVANRNHSMGESNILRVETSSNIANYRIKSWD